MLSFHLSLDLPEGLPDKIMKALLQKVGKDGIVTSLVNRNTGMSHMRIVFYLLFIHLLSNIHNMLPFLNAIGIFQKHVI